MSDDRDISALRHYVARLEGDLAVAENDLDDMRAYCKLQALDIITLGHEVGRLREALEKIATIQGGGDCCSVYEWFVYAKRIAHAALTEQTGFNEPTPHKPQYPFEIKSSAEKEKG